MKKGLSIYSIIATTLTLAILEPVIPPGQIWRIVDCYAYHTDVAARDFRSYWMDGKVAYYAGLATLDANLPYSFQYARSVFGDHIWTSDVHGRITVSGLTGNACYLVVVYEEVFDSPKIWSPR